MMMSSFMSAIRVSELMIIIVVVIIVNDTFTNFQEICCRVINLSTFPQPNHNITAKALCHSTVKDLKLQWHVCLLTYSIFHLLSDWSR